MRCYPEALAHQLQKSLAPIYVLYGPETFLIEESRALIKEVFTRPEIEHFVFHTHENLEKILTITQQLGSLFANKRFIEIRIDSITSKEAQLLLKILEEQNTDTTLLIQTGSLSYAQQQAKWFTYASQKGVVITHWPLSSEHFSKWVEKRAKQRGLKFNCQALSLLIYHTEGNCLAAAQEIERLFLCYGAGNQELTITHLTQQSQFDVFSLREACVACNKEMIVKILSCLKQSHAPQLILWMLTQTVRILLRCLKLPEKEQLFQLKESGIRMHHVIYIQAVKRFSFYSLSTLLSYLSLADRQLKSGEIQASWQNILEISLVLGGVSLEFMQNKTLELLP